MTSELKQTIRHLLNDGHSHRKIQQILIERGEYAALSTISEVRKSSVEIARYAPIDDNADNIASWKDAIELCRRAQRLHQQNDISDYEVHLTVDTIEPLILLFFCDPHIGSPYVDYDEFERQLELAKGTDNVKIIYGNDANDNFGPGFKDKQAIFTSVLQPQQQQIATQHIIKELDELEKLLIYMPGNHDAFARKDSPYDLDYFIHQGRKNYVYMRDGGLVWLTVGGEKYSLLMRHKYGGNSGRDKLASNKFMMERLYPLAEITLQGDKHDPAMAVEYRYEHDLADQKIHMRGGTFKTLGDGYSRTGWKDGILGIPALVLFPDKHKKVPFTGPDAFEDAISYRNGIQKK